MKFKYLFALFIINVLVLSCSKNFEKTDKHQKRRNKVVDLSEKINDIKTDILFGNCFLYILDKYLVISETAPSGERGIHLLNKNTFKYITSTAIIGNGPGEVTRQGRLGIDSKNKIIWVSDHGKKTMWKFPLDSILNNKMYKPTEKLDLNDELFIERFGILNDSIALGKAVRVLSTNSFEMVTAKLNTLNNITKTFGYEHPEAVGYKSNSLFALSLKNNIYVNSYSNCDLITICDLEGNLKYNVFGSDAMSNKDFKKAYYFGVDIIDSSIIASYINDKSIVFDKFKRPKGNLPTKFLVFDLEGNYKYTIETGCKFTYFCIDEENKRVIAFFDGRENPLGYINLND